MAKRKSKKSQEKAVRVTLVKSTIGCTRDQRATVAALGLRKMHATRVHIDTPQIRGMIHKVIHLVDVEEVEGE